MARAKGIKPMAQNKKAFHDYFVEERLECGMELKGTEVKSMRQGRMNLKESFAIRQGRRGARLRHAHQPLRAGQHLQHRPASAKEAAAAQEPDSSSRAGGRQDGLFAHPASGVFEGRALQNGAGALQGQKSCTTSATTWRPRMRSATFSAPCARRTAGTIERVCADLYGGCTGFDGIVGGQVSEPWPRAT